MIELSFDSVHDNVCHLHVYNSAGLYIYTIKEMYSVGGNKRGGRTPHPLVHGKPVSAKPIMSLPVNKHT